jgi:hypothetical protein
LHILPAPCVFLNGRFSRTFLLQRFYIQRKHLIFAAMKQKKRKTAPARDKHIAFSLNSEEYDFISSYIRKYRISNKSRWLRETVIGHILKTLEQDYPTLFGENDMRR